MSWNSGAMDSGKSALNPAWRACLSRGLLGLIFAALVYRANSGAARYIWRQPGSFDEHSALGLLRNSAPPLACAVGFGFIFCSAGATLLRKIEDRDDPVFRMSASFALGAGFCALLLFFLGIVSRLGPLEVGGMFLLLVCAGLPTAVQWARRPPAAARRCSLDAVDSTLAVLLAYVLWHGLITALAPPTDADALAYHLALPKIYASTGRIADIPWLIFSHWPHLAQILYTLGMFLHMDCLPALLHLAAAAALVFAVFNAGRQWLGARAAWLAAALLAAQPVLGGFAGTPRIEAWWALFGFLASVYAWRWTLNGSTSCIVLSGIYAGFAASSKLMGMASLVILAAWVAMQGRHSSRAHALRAAGCFLAAGLILVLPWYLKTWIQIGNPVWPFFVNQLGGRSGAELVAPRFLAMNRWPSPLSLSILLRNGPQFTLAPLIAAASALFLTQRSRSDWPPFLSFLWATLLPYAPLVLWNYEAWRYLAPALPAMALTIGWCCASLIRDGDSRRWIGAAAAVFGLCPVLLLSQNNALFAVLELHSISSPGRPARDMYIERTVAAYAFFSRVNERLANRTGPSPNILLVNENGGYWLDVPYQWGSPHYQGLVTYGAFADGASLARELRRMGITHILINSDPAAMAPLDARDRIVLSDAFNRSCDEQLKSGGYHLFRLKDA